MREIKRQFLKIMRLLMNKYVLISFAGVLLMLFIYTSYAFIRTELDWKTASQIKFSNLTYTLKINNTSTSTITSVANSGTVYYDVEITSLNETDTRYLLTYNSTVAGVEVKTSSKSINASSGKIGEYGNGSGTTKSKVIRIAVINNTASAATITLEIRGGYTWNSAGSTKPRLNYKIINNLVYETALNNYLSLSEEVAEVLNCTPTSTLPCLYKENANNYITYSNHKWRMLGTYLINGEKVVKLILDDVLDTPVTYANVQSALTAFYNTLDTSYIRQSSPFTCTGTSTISCTGSANIGLLSKSEYDLIYGENSYLYTLPKKNYWTNTASGSNYYVGTSRGINSQEVTLTAYVRPVIYLKSNIKNLAEQSEYTITNLITNGSFENSLTGWTNYGEPLSIMLNGGAHTGNNYLRIIPSGTYNGAYTEYVHVNTTDVIYIAGYYRKNGGGDASFQIYDFARQLYPPNLGISLSTPTNYWTQFSSRGVATYSELNVFPFGSSGNYVAGMYSDYDSLMLINLTATFGTGNEPSKEWCDENLEYFSGNITKKAKIGEYKLGTKINPYVANNGVFLEVKLNEGSTSQSFSDIYPQNSTVTLIEPTKNKYQFIEWEVTGTGSSVFGNTLTIGTDKTTLIAKWALQEFEYIAPNNDSNPYYEYVVPKSGWYEMETWGAQGGSLDIYNNTKNGGKGAYTSGKIYLNANETLYVYVGGQGQDITSPGSIVGLSNTSSSAVIPGGYNGGGSGIDESDGTTSNSETATSGGGATDIRISTSTNSINSRIMVAAGGSGAYNVNATFNGAPGGGLIGIHNNDSAYNSTQLSGNAFGFGINGVYYTHAGDWGSSGGGGGYYGGTNYATPDSGAGIYNVSSGGSSFISGYAGVMAIDEGSESNPRAHTNNNTKHYSGKYFVDGVMIPGNQSMPSPSGGTEIGHSGNGYARIKYLGSSAPTRTNTKLNDVRYIKDCADGNTVNGTGYVHWAEIQAIENGINVAQGIIGTLYDSSGNSVSSLGPGYAFSYATDGDYTNIMTSGVGIARGTSLSANQCFVIDLGSVKDLDEIGIWHYWVDGRTYYSNTTYVSSDGTNWTLVIATQEPESSQGKRVSAYDENTTVTPIYTVTNLVTNGSFENGTSGWTNKGGSIAVLNGGVAGSKYLRITPNSTYNGAYTGYIYVDTTDIMYFSGYYRKYGGGKAWFYVYDSAKQLYPPFGSNFDLSTPTDNWTRFSSRGVATYSQFNVYPFGSSGNYVAGMYSDYDAIMLINLTDTFGPGREPTKEWCDQNFDYFDGTQLLNLNY